MMRVNIIWPRVIALLSALVAVTVAAIVVFLLVAPLPALAVTPQKSLSDSIQIDEVVPSWPAEPAAIAVWQSDTVRTNGNETSTTMASLAKLICAVVSLEYKPFEEDDQATYVLGPRDAQYVADVLAEDGSTEPVKQGTALTRRQMLELMLIASANNYALSYVDWIFGSNETFVAETRKFLDAHGLGSVTVVEPTGLSLSNIGSAADLARIGALALDYPILADITAMKSAEIPGVGTIENTNMFLGAAGVRGLKTGTTSAGRNLMLAQDVTLGEGDAKRTVTFVISTLAQPSAEARISVNRALLVATEANVQQVAVLTDHELVGTVTTWTGETVELFTDGAASAVLTFDEKATRKLTVSPITAAADVGGQVGRVSVSSPTGKLTVPVVLGEAIAEPDAWWRLTHPFEMFGWR